MSWADLLILCVLVAIITVVSIIFGYALALKHIRQERQRHIQERNKYRNSDTPIYDRLADDFYDVT